MTFYRVIRYHAVGTSLLTCSTPALREHEIIDNVQFLILSRHIYLVFFGITCDCFV